MNHPQANEQNPGGFPAPTLILGGDFGGIATANALRRLLPPRHALAVIDHSPRF